jgi:hypothetical protein
LKKKQRSCDGRGGGAQRTGAHVRPKPTSFVYVFMMRADLLVLIPEQRENKWKSQSCKTKRNGTENKIIHKKVKKYKKIMLDKWWVKNV